MSKRYHLLIPHYRHVDRLTRFLPRLASAGLPVLVVDDGSDRRTLKRLRDLVAGYSWASLLERDRNGGKGAAVIAGMEYLYDRGATHAISVDADGQHDPGDVARFRRASERSPRRLLSGRPVFADSIPASRLHGRKVTNWLARSLAGGNRVEDAMCGFRLYPLATVLPLVPALGNRVRMEFDVEILVRACWAGIELEFIPTRVDYPKEGLSHFRLIADNLRFARMHSVLTFEALGRSLRPPRGCGTGSPQA